MLRAFLQILLIAAANVGLGQPDRTVEAEQVKRGTNVQLFVTAPPTISLGQKLSIQVVLTNAGNDVVYISHKNSYTDFEIRVFDQEGNPCALTEFGMRKLAPMMPGFTSTVKETNRIAYVRFGGSITSALKPAGEEFSSYTSNIEISRCYQLQPGRYRIEVTYVRDVSLRGLKAKPVFFDVMTESEDN